MYDQPVYVKSFIFSNRHQARGRGLRGSPMMNPEKAGIDTCNLDRWQAGAARGLHALDVR